MASSSDNISMAVFCDFENVALGVRDANYEKFDIKPVLERLLLKGSIVVKKAYCDWDRYKGFKSTMHEANFELIEIPHVRQSGKNSADIRLVVDALDLCYTKSHVNTFVIISGDSDFSPLVSKLRENAKQVIGVGVKQSTSDLLVANCDEFIFYDDLVREQRRAAAKRDERKAQPQARRPSDDRRKEELESRKVQALEMVVETFDALVSERGDTGKIWASLLKDTLKRRRPDFSETYYGFRTFGNLLEEAQTRGLFEFGRDEKSGTYVYRSANAPSVIPAAEAATAPASDSLAIDVGAMEAPTYETAQAEPANADSRRRGRGGRNQRGRAEAPAPVEVPEEAPEDAAEVLELTTAGVGEPAPAPEAAPEQVQADTRRRGRGGRNGRGRAAAAVEVSAEAPVDVPADVPEAEVLELTTSGVAAPAPAGEDAALAESATEVAAAPVKERRRAARKPAAKKAAPVADVAAELAAAPAPELAAPDADAGPEAAAEADGEAGDDAKSARKNTARGAHKAPARKSAPRGRRPAKPKGTPDNG